MHLFFWIPSSFFCLLPVVIHLDKENALRERMTRLGIREADLEEQFVRSSGPGGQNVNKLSTCVLLLHRPTGFRVRCQISRSQHENRYRARVLLCERLEERIQGIESARAREIRRIRTQKRKRSKRAREKMLREKKSHSLKKQLRRPPDLDA